MTSMITGDNDTNIDEYKKGYTNEQQESAWTRHSEATTLIVRAPLLQKEFPLHFPIISLKEPP